MREHTARGRRVRCIVFSGASGTIGREGALRREEVQAVWDDPSQDVLADAWEVTNEV